MKPRSWKQFVLVFAAGLILLGGIYEMFKPKGRSISPQTATSAAAPLDQAAQVTEVQVEVQHGQRVAGPEVIAVTQGDRVILSVLGDEDDHLHLHGYDLEMKLKKGQPARLDFVANKTGRFEYELHHAHLDLGALEVRPR